MRNSFFRVIFSLAVPAILIGCGAAEESSSVASQPLQPVKVASFTLSSWYPSCAGGGCWLDFKNDEGSWALKYQVSYESGDYAAKTTGKFLVTCKDGRTVTEQIPTNIQVGWTSPWYVNPCPGKLVKMTMKAGLDGTWGEGKLSYWQKWF
jgi:hypothetical protein